MSFIKTIIPTESYQEVKQIGDRYIVHLNPVENNGEVECYECITDSPNIEDLQAELESLENARLLRKASYDRQARMKEILAELQATDYLALKAFEGEDMSEHPTWKEDRAALRSEYRKLEAEEQAQG